MSHISPIERRLHQGPILGSGGFGTTAGWHAEENHGIELQLPLWSAAFNFDNTELLVAVHRMFRDAGAEILLANTFRMQRDRIEQAYPGRGEEMTETGVRNAMLAAHQVKRESSNRLFVGGSYGPIGGTHDGPASGLPFDQLYAQHLEQAERIAKHNPDFMAPEAMSRLDEVIASAQAASEIFKHSNGTIPFILGITLGANGRLYGDNASIKDVAEAVKNLPGNLGIVFNCTQPGVIRSGLEELLSVYPRFVGGSANGPGTPHENGAGWNPPVEKTVETGKFADTTVSWRNLSPRVTLLAGCCGADPDSIAAVGKKLANENEQAQIPAWQTQPERRANSRFAADNALAAAPCPCPINHSLSL